MERIEEEGFFFTLIMKAWSAEHNHLKKCGINANFKMYIDEQLASRGVIELKELNRT